ncbi:MAG: Ig-like domain-containing protein [Candidatus Cloacimonetes bacterium]|nr:Ig-like domain-containing protein [Candidatus Cloacimonadota bacterium]
MLDFKIGQKLTAVTKIIGIILIVLVFISCSKTTKPDDSDSGKGYLLVIEEGARSLRGRETITYTASLLDALGKSTTQTSVNWTSSNESAATINNGTVSVVDLGSTEITASVTVDGETYTASVPLVIRLESPLPYVVVPEAIIAITGEQIELEVINFSAENINPIYVSSNGNVASVNSSGVVAAISEGFTEIKANYQNMSFVVPVLVTALPEINFPVVRVNVSPESQEMFINDSFQFSANAINSESQSVDITIEWKSTDPLVASIDQNGNVTAVSVGATKIQAIANGIIGEAECHVLPDTIIIVTPFLQSIGAGQSFTFNAQAYSLKNEQYLPNIDDFYWFMPQYPPPFDQFFNNASVNQAGTVSVEFDAIPGMMGFTLVSLSDDPDNPLGCGVYMVDLGFPK